MLDSLRKKKENIIFTGLILVLAGLMSFFGLGRLNQPHSKNSPVAWVNGHAISQIDYESELEYRKMQYSQMFGGQMDESIFNLLQIPQKTLDNLIEFKLLSLKAKHSGFQFSDDELVDYVKTIPYFQTNGKFDPKLYASKLANPRQQEEKQQEGLLVSRYQHYLTDRIQITPTLSRQLYFLKETKIDFEYAKIDASSLTKSPKPTEAQIKSLLKESTTHTSIYEELKKEYAEHPKDFKNKEEAELKRIRIGIPFQASESVKERAKNTIFAISKEVTVKNFDAIAKAKSDDEYARKGGYMGWIKRDALLPQVDKALRDVLPQKISPPIETPFGYYIFYVMNKKPESIKPMTDPSVQNELASRVIAKKHLQTYKDKLIAKLTQQLKKNIDIRGELKRENIKLTKVSFSTSNESAQGLPPSHPSTKQQKDILTMVMTLSEKEPQLRELIVYSPSPQPASLNAASNDTMSYYYVRLISRKEPQLKDFFDDKKRTPAIASELNSWQMGLINLILEKEKKAATITYKISFDKKNKETPPTPSSNQ